MIGIRYQKPTPTYDAYLARVQNYILSKSIKNPDILRFVNTYLTGSNFARMMNTSADNLRFLIANIESNFHELKTCRYDAEQRKDSELYKFLKYHFVERGYERGYQEDKIKYNIPRKELIDSLGIDVCPYCNRAFIYTTKSVKNEMVAQAEIDHFFSKKLFPYLAIAKYNLVPSCSCCNRNGGKFTTDAYDNHLINPYEVDSSSAYLEFRLRVKNANVTSLDELANGLSLKLIAKQQNMQKNIDSLNLKGLYQHHTDYAAELYIKWLVKATKIYRTSIKSLLRKQGITLTDNDMKRIIVGNYVMENDFGKRPLSKMMHDIALELGLI